MKKILETLRRKWAEYLLEMFVITFGVVGAFMLNNWNEYQKDRAKETMLLSELKQDLKFNLSNLEYGVFLENQCVKSIEMIVDHLDNFKPYHDSLDFYFAQVVLTPELQLSTKAFESIKSMGFEIIQSDSLRNAVISLFDQRYPWLLEGDINDRYLPQFVIPVYQAHFRTISGEGLGKSKPTDYESLLNDTKYKNMILHLKAARLNELYAIEVIHDESQHLLNLIDSELKN